MNLELSRQQALHPSFAAQDLGRAIPASKDAVSVCLPTIESVERYEEGDPEVITALQTGYPRFVLHAEVQHLVDQFRSEHPDLQDSFCLPFPSPEAAMDCIRFCHAGGLFHGATELLHDLCVTEYAAKNATSNPVYMLVAPDTAEVVSQMRSYWQHTGRLVSSRQARDLCTGSTPAGEVSVFDSVIREEISLVAGCRAESVFLYPTGMAALYAAFRLVHDFQSDTELGDKPTVQFGFPYVDTDKIQSKTRTGRILLPEAGSQDLAALAQLVARGEVSAVFTEFPSNPLLSIPDLRELSAILRPAGIPLVVDETLATFCNADVSPYADIIATSLTKFYSGSATVMGGSLIVSDHSPLHDVLHRQLQAKYVPETYVADLAVLAEQGGTHFIERMHAINSNSLQLAQHLQAHPLVAKVHYPALSASVENFQAVQRPGGGFGGLLSIELIEPERTTRPFYDALQLSKGPSLGSEFTLVCPYTLLAHYRELEEVAQRGISKHLIRVSVGSVETASGLVDAFDSALESARKIAGC